MLQRCCENGYMQIFAQGFVNDLESAKSLYATAGYGSVLEYHLFSECLETYFILFFAKLQNLLCSRPCTVALKQLFVHAERDITSFKRFFRQL